MTKNKTARIELIRTAGAERNAGPAIDEGAATVALHYGCATTSGSSRRPPYISCTQWGRP